VAVLSTFDYLGVQRLDTVPETPVGFVEDRNGIEEDRNNGVQRMKVLVF
jgi:hypothetical protein